MTSRQKPTSPTEPRWSIGWSNESYGSALDCFKTLQKFKASEFWYDLELGSLGSVDGAEEGKLRCLFDQFLCIFHEETCGTDSLRALPPMLGDGQPIDLFKLYFLVREKGGYETVSTEGLWDRVAAESGLGSSVGSDLKLFYAKNLDRLDRWLQRILKDKDSKGGLQDSGADLSGGSMELEPEFCGFSSEDLDQKKEDGEYPPLDLDDSYMGSTVRKLCNDNEVLGLEISDESRKSVEHTKNSYEGKVTMISDPSVVTQEVSSRKRKHKCKWKMLDWVVEVAKNPCDKTVGSLPERYNWKRCGSEQLWKQVLLAREAMFLKRDVNIRADQSVSNWLKQKMHPSMYDDHTGSERVRSSKRTVSAKEPQTLPSRKRACSDSSSGPHSDLEDHLVKESEPLSADSVFVFLDDNRNRKRVPVGPFFQANVPEWTGETYESDSRWLGSRVWPLESEEHNKYLIERDRIGKGRQDSCGCENPGSVECVKFHVTEKRKRVKLELGLAFPRWKFDKMGEEVALSWTKKEEKRFEEIMTSNPQSMDKCFWNEILKSFPSKKREDLVSYYFNVFLLQQRGYQNRSTPSNIDTDDEESDFGSPTSGFMHEAVKSSSSIFRSPKKPHLNFR